MESKKDTSPLALTDQNEIRNKIYTIRGVQVMLDSDLAKIYGYTTKAFNQQVKNNAERFPSDFMIELTMEEAQICSRSKILTLNGKAGRGRNIKYLPYAFTEQGIYMLMTVLKGELAVKQSKMLIRIFKEMRRYLADNALVFNRLDRIEIKQLEADIVNASNNCVML